jgi:hypothetical protein
MIADQVPSDSESGRNELIWLHRFGQTIIAHGGSLLLPTDPTQGIDPSDKIVFEIASEGKTRFFFQKTNP